MSDPRDGDIERLRERFAAIYDRNEWGFQSGVGAQPANNLEYSAFVQNFIHRNAVKSVVDFGCGDWQFSRFIDWTGLRYLGTDIVPGLIERNRRIFGQEHIAFELFSSVDALPAADLLVCKDVLQHLPNPMVQQYLDQFKSKFKFMLITNDDAPIDYLNIEIQPGGWRTLRFDQPPFSETAAIVLQWTVHAGRGWTRKACYLFYGRTSA
jgi:SAM-dependent methyltransferase